MNTKIFFNREGSFLIQNLLLTVLLYGVHWYLLNAFASDTQLFFPLWQIYLFHFIVTALVFTAINYFDAKGKKNVFIIFMATTFLKMALAIIFLLPLILSDFENKQPDVFNFFIPYFIYLFFEVFKLTKFLQKPS